MKIDKFINAESCQDVAILCSPLSHLGLELFHYQETLNNGERVCLTNNLEWMRYFFQSGIYKTGAFQQHPDFYNTGYALRTRYNEDNRIKKARERFNVGHQGVTITKKEKDRVKIYFFSTSKNKNDFFEMFLQENIALFDDFINYFHQQGRTLVTRAFANRMTLAPLSLPTKRKRRCNFSKKAFYDDLTKDNLSLSHDNKLIRLSDDEKKLIEYVCDGWPSRKIGELMSVSAKTVEWHIAKLKKRFDAKNLVMLINILHKLNLIQ